MEAAHINFARAEMLVCQQRAVDSASPSPLKFDTCAATIPVSRDLLEELRQAARDNMRANHRQTRARRRFLFPYYRLDQDRLLTDLRRIAPADFPPGDAWHVLRHTFGTEAVDRFGERLEIVQGLMRHKSIKSTQSYVASIRGGYFPGEAMRRLLELRQAAAEAYADLPKTPAAMAVDVEHSPGAVPRLQAVAPSNPLRRK